MTSTYVYTGSETIRRLFASRSYGVVPTVKFEVGNQVLVVSCDRFNGLCGVVMSLRPTTGELEVLINNGRKDSYLFNEDELELEGAAKPVS